MGVKIGRGSRSHFPEQRLIIEPSPYVATMISAFGSSLTSVLRQGARRNLLQHTSLIVKGIVGHHGRMHCFFHDIVAQVVDRNVLAAYC